MTTALHTWLNHAQETTRIDSVTAKYGLVVDTPGTSQAGQNALRFLRSLSEHSPTFFDSQARLLSPPTPDLIPDLPASPLATPMSMSWGGPQRTARRPGRMPRSPYAPDSDALFAFEMPAEEPTYVPNHPAARRAAGSRARPYPACRAYTSPTPAHVDLSRSPPPLGSGYFPPAPEPSPAFDMFPQQQPQRQQSWDNGYPGAIPTPTINTQAHSYPTYLPSPSASSYTSTQSYPFQQSQFSPITQQQQQYQEPELDMDHCGDDADRERMSALMYGSMRARTVVAASEADPQGW